MFQFPFAFISHLLGVVWLASERVKGRTKNPQICQQTN